MGINLTEKGFKLSREEGLFYVPHLEIYIKTGQQNLQDAENTRKAFIWILPEAKVSAEAAAFFNASAAQTPHKIYGINIDTDSDFIRATDLHTGTRTTYYFGKKGKSQCTFEEEVSGIETIREKMQAADLKVIAQKHNPVINGRHGLK